MTDRETEEYRAKLIQRYEEMNISVFTEEELIDFLLLTVCSKKDYIKIKEALVENFGMNLSKIIDTGSDNLEKIGGIDKQTANFISMIPTVARVYCLRMMFHQCIIQKCLITNILLLLIHCSGTLWV